MSTEIPDQVTRSVEDAVSYPILTRETGPSGGGADVLTSRVGSGATLTRSAQTAIRQALGWRYRNTDVKGFLAALNKSFALKEVEGHVEWDWKPQNYSLQADLGELTGAQASLYTRAKAAVDQSLSLLDGLTPLRSDADQEQLHSNRTIARTHLGELLEELGRLGGPRIQRVEALFELLIGPAGLDESAETIDGQMGQLRRRFGLENRRVNTIAQEQVLTSFRVVVDYLTSLRRSWNSNRSYFERNAAQPFLGTQLVLLSQALESLVETIGQAYDAMDSVFFGPAQRQATPLEGLDKEAPISVAELLDWLEQSAGVDGRQLVQEAGKAGVVAFRATLQRLANLLALAVQKSAAKPESGRLPREFHTLRVRRALEAIQAGVRNALGLIANITPPDPT